METKISLGALPMPGAVSVNEAPPEEPQEAEQSPLQPQGASEPQAVQLPARDVPFSIIQPEPLDNTVVEETNLPQRAGTNQSIALPNVPKPSPNESAQSPFDLRKGMDARTNPGSFGGMPPSPSPLEAAEAHLEADHSKEEAITKLATKTIVDVQRQEMALEKVKTEFAELKAEHIDIQNKLQNTIDYLNAVALQVQMLNAQNMYMAWHGRLVEYNLASLAGVQMERDLLDQAKNQIHHWQQETMRKQTEAEAAFAKISP